MKKLILQYTQALIAAARQGCRVLVALNKADIVPDIATSKAELEGLLNKADIVPDIATSKAELEGLLTQIFIEDDDAARINAVGMGLDEPPETESLPSTLAADLAPEDVHAISALGVEDGFDALFSQISSCLDEAVAARAESLKRLVCSLHEPLRGMKHKLQFWQRFTNDESDEEAKVGKGDRAIGMLYREAIAGTAVTNGAIQQAEEALAACGGDVTKAVTNLARWDVSGAFIRGGIAGVGGFTTMLVSVPASVAASWLMGMRLAFAIAHLGGHDIFEPAVCNLAFGAMTGEPRLGAVVRTRRNPPQHDSGKDSDKMFVLFQPTVEGGGGWGGSEGGGSEMMGSQKLAQTVGQAQLQRAMAAAASRGLSEAAAAEMAEAAAKRAAQAALERLTQQELAEAAGIKLATAGAGRSLAKAIPLIGAAISGAVESYTAEQVARRAKESFAPGQTEVVAECSWCLRTVPHARTRVGTMSRDAFQCSACSNKTLRCTTTGCERMARGGVLWDRGLCARCDPSSRANLSRTSSAQAAAEQAPQRSRRPSGAGAPAERR